MSKKKKIFITSCIILAILVGAAYAWSVLVTDEAANVTDETASVSQEEAENEQEPGNDSSPGISPPQTEGRNDTPTVPKKSVNVTMTSPVNGQEISTSTVQVRAYVTGASSGSCIVKFTKSGYKTIRETASIAQGPSYYNCQGFNVARSKFPTNGQWQVTVYFSSDTAEGQSQTNIIILK